MLGGQCGGSVARPTATSSAVYSRSVLAPVLAPSARPFNPFQLARNVQQRQQRGSRQQVQAVKEWPDAELLEYVKENFPDAGVADAEEARALFSDLGYTYLDVRPALELEEVGKVKGCVNIPIVNARRRYNPEQKKKVLEKEDNPDFVAQVEKKFPDKDDAKLLIACSNGKKYSMDALVALDEAGYTNLVGLKGGYYAWNRKFDNKLGRRRFGEYQENYIHDGDSCGIHSSGAGFERVDSIEPWIPPDY